MKTWDNLTESRNSDLQQLFDICDTFHTVTIHIATVITWQAPQKAPITGNGIMYLRHIKICRAQRTNTQ